MLLLLGYTRQRSWAGWSCHSFALEVISIVMLWFVEEWREGGAEVCSLFFWGFLVWVRSADWPQSSQLLWLGAAGNAWTGVVPELLTLCSASLEPLADWCECRALIYCSSRSSQLPLRTEFFPLVWRRAVQTVPSSLTRCLWEIQRQKLAELRWQQPANILVRSEKNLFQHPQLCRGKTFEKLMLMYLSVCFKIAQKPFRWKNHFQDVKFLVLASISSRI